MRRSPYGERGLKFSPLRKRPRSARRSPYGERGLKCNPNFCKIGVTRRSPYGERGLKYQAELIRSLRPESLSLRRAWIEMFTVRYRQGRVEVALLTESVD